MKVLAGAYWDKERKEPVNTRAALKRALRDENIHKAIPGVTTFDQLAQNMSVMEDLALTEEERRDLRLDEDAGGNGLFCSQCGQCRSQRAYGLEIPTAMRSYMYAYDYAAPAKAKQTLREAERALLTCRECWPCSVKCAMGFDVREKITDISRLLSIPDEFLA
jgi:predicted aldo/keto reductase-like oxidoreductase